MEKLKTAIFERVSNNSKLRGKIQGFTMIANWFLEKTGFSIYEKMVVIVIKKHLMNNHEAWPSLEKIATQSGCSVSSVKKAILELQNKNIVEKSRPNYRKTNIYKIKLDRF